MLEFLLLFLSNFPSCSSFVIIASRLTLLGIVLCCMLRRGQGVNNLFHIDLEVGWHFEHTKEAQQEKEGEEVDLRGRHRA